MDVTHGIKKVSDFLKKYRYVVLVLLIGLALMLLPSQKTVKQEMQQTVCPEQISMNEQLSEILSNVKGAGNVQVLLTIQAGEETLYQVDEVEEVSEQGSSTKVSTIIISNMDKQQTGLVRQVIPPIYKGAVVVCQGGDNPSVKLAITEAVSKVTGLGADRISVLKMK